MELTYLDSNSWLIEFEGTKILLDPWIVGDLTFNDTDWLFKSSKNQQHSIPENIDLILLSQGLEDHAHPPTLKALAKNIPVVASPNGAKVARDLGYETVTTLEHGEVYTLKNCVEIKALPGSRVGATTVENGYLFKGLKSHKTMYYEPHGNHCDEIKKADSVDVVITPLVNLKLPLVGSVIKGQKTALELCQRLKPQVILSTAAGGDVEVEGLITSVLEQKGTVEEFSQLLKQNDLSTKAIEPKSGEHIELSLV